MIGSSLGSYRVVRKLGEGGMGVVYEAEHQVLGKRAVIKLLRAELSTNPELVNRFFNEARSAAHVKHEGIVEVLDFGQDAHGTAFIVMEYLDGETLGARVRREGRLPFDVAATIGRQAALAVHAAHTLGIVHRDLKPDNLFLVPDRELAYGVRVKVLDFGIAKLLDDGAAVDVRTRTGAVLGTPFYMSPEQCRGAQQIDSRSDVYALGCILYEMVCGFPPFRAAGLGDLIVMHVTEPPQPPSAVVPGIPRGLEVAILRALAKKPWERQQSAELLAAELRGASPSNPPGLRHAGPGDPAQLPTAHHAPLPLPHLTTGPRAPIAPRRRGRGLAIAVIVAVVAAIASLVTYGVVTSSSRATATAGSAGSPTAGSGALPCGTVAACMTAADALKGEAALAILDPLCKRGHAPACKRAAGLTSFATGEAHDPARSAAYHQAGCDLGDIDSCFWLGAAYRDGTGIAHDAVRAAALLDRACTGKVADACAALGSDLMDGDHGLPADPPRAITLNQNGCDLGSLPACTNLGFQIETGNGAPVDLGKARALYERACGPSSPKACENLCMVYVFAKGVDKDERAALPLCRKACEHGDMSGCTWTGYLYMKKGGVPVDGNQAMTYFDQACTGGDMKGCFAAARTLQDGEIVQRDRMRARALYERACDSGNSAESCTNLGAMIADGEGGKPDLRRGLELFENACEGGDALGCFKAGRFYHYGFKTVARDEARAKQYFDRACKRQPALCNKDPSDPKR